jgi:DNA uptake protein ComE-like DNA-binding protein
MMIEIHSPEAEAIILERMSSGAFRNIEDVIVQALRFSSAQSNTNHPLKNKSKTETAATAPMDAESYD